MKKDKENYHAIIHISTTTTTESGHALGNPTLHSRTCNPCVNPCSTIRQKVGVMEGSDGDSSSEEVFKLLAASTPLKFPSRCIDLDDSDSNESLETPKKEKNGLCLTHGGLTWMTPVHPAQKRHFLRKPLPTYKESLCGSTLMAVPVLMKILLLWMTSIKTPST